MEQVVTQAPPVQSKEVKTISCVGGGIFTSPLHYRHSHAIRWVGSKFTYKSGPSFVYFW